MKKQKTKVAVLMGGVSSEREVSLHSGAGVAKALRSAGFEVVEAVVDEADLGCLDGVAADAVFVALHGAFGEDGQVQRLLEKAGLPYTGSGPEASLLAMDKVQSKERFAAAGLVTPEFLVAEAPAAGAQRAAVMERLGPVVVVKPAAQGSSIGVSIVEADGLAAALSEAVSFDGRAVVERYIPGREITVGIVGEEALGVIELRPHHKFFDYTAKYTKGETDYIIDPELPGGIAQEARAAALAAFRSLGCRDLARVDMIYGDDGRLYVLEVNTIPGFTETSLVPMAAAARGRDFPALCGDLVRMATERVATRTC